MNSPLRLAFAIGLCLQSALSAAVTVSELSDRIRVEINGELFTEWRHKEWVAPYLYPVTGPTGENITRNFPMQTGVAAEEQDHPWQRSIRFAHSDVNGFNFWWAPGKALAGHSVEIKLERIESMRSGETGEVVLWNQWLGNGEVMMREKVRLCFTPLEKREVLMDFDVEFQASNGPVVFGDKRDGGLLARVAGTMKVEDEKGNKFNGAIVNSRGDRNADAWGKRAEWVDYSGPDAAGRPIGIALFDHPSNLRFPTHWHARTYGLMTANRFGTDHFKGNYSDHKNLVCKPAGTNCPACASHSGDYTLPAGAALTLRNRFFFHHGDAQAASVAEKYRAYASEPASIVSLMRELSQQRKWKELVETYGAEDFAAWSESAPSQANEAFRLRGNAYYALKNGAQAEIEFRKALAISSGDGVLLAWVGLADNYLYNLKHEAKALEAHKEVLNKTGPKANGWLPINSTISIARLLIDQVKLEEALAVLNQFEGTDSLAPVWKIKLCRAYGQLYAAMGREAESLSKFREAIALEGPR